MICVDTIGGNKKQRDLVNDVAYWCINKLMPRMKNLDIEIQINNLKDSAVGYCMMGYDNRNYELEVDKKLDEDEMIVTVCHEMVHVKQYARKELTCVGVQSRWKGEAVGSRVQYHNLPWEKEAFKLQDVLAVKCLKDIYSDEY